MRCMWPSVDDDVIKLCREDADFMVNGFSYCEEHTINFVEASAEQSATMEVPDDEQWYSPNVSQDQIDNEENGQWTYGISYNGGGDE